MSVFFQNGYHISEKVKKGGNNLETVDNSIINQTEFLFKPCRYYANDPSFQIQNVNQIS